jgi:hypothetical protein
MVSCCCVSRNSQVIRYDATFWIQQGVFIVLELGLERVAVSSCALSILG